MIKCLPVNAEPIRAVSPPHNYQKRVDIFSEIYIALPNKFCQFLKCKMAELERAFHFPKWVSEAR